MPNTQPPNQPTNIPQWVIDPQIKSKVGNGDLETQMPVIIRLKDNVTIDIAEELDRLSYLQVERNKDGSPYILNFGNIHMVVAKITGYKNLEAFVNQYKDKILFVEGNYPAPVPESIVSKSSLIVAKADDTIKWYLDFIDAPQVWQKQVYGVNITGLGVNIAMLDSGIDDWYFETPEGNYSKPGGDIWYQIDALAGWNNRVEYYTPGWSGVDPVPDTHPLDKPHGTGTAAVAAGGKGYGVAPQANLIDIRVFATWSMWDSARLSSAIHWCVDHGVDVISMSLGDNINSHPTVWDAIEYAYFSGVPVCVAAGNGNNALYSIWDPGVAKYAITVMGCFQNGNPSTATSFGPTSDKRPKPEIIAPSADEVAGTTSFATPCASGTAALLVQYLMSTGQQRRYRGVLVRAAIIRAAALHDIGDIGWEHNHGHGYLNALDAYKYVSGEYSYDLHAYATKWRKGIVTPDYWYLVWVWWPWPWGSWIPRYGWYVYTAVESDGQMEPYKITLVDSAPSGADVVSGNPYREWTSVDRHKYFNSYTVEAWITHVTFLQPYAVASYT